MTEEQWKKRNAKLKEIEEQRKKARYICDGHFITLDVYKNFLKEHGYILTAYDGGCNIDWDSKHINFFKFYEGFNRHLNENMILVGKPEDWGEYIKENWWCNNICNNPFIKYIKSNFTTFKIYTIIENEDAKSFTFGPRDEYLYCPKLEKDLSKEWIKYLVKTCPEFATYQIEKCENQKIEAQKHLEYKLSLIRKRYEELKKEEAELPIERDKEINKNNDIILTVKQAILENKTFTTKQKRLLKKFSSLTSNQLDESLIRYLTMLNSLEGDEEIYVSRIAVLKEKIELIEYELQIRKNKLRL